MTTPVTKPFGPPTECEAAAQSYQDDHGLTTGVYRTGVWLVTGPKVEALDMPAELGKRLVLTTPVPVFESPDDHEIRWVLLTRPHTGPTLPELAGLGIDHIRWGRPVDLPPSRFGRHRLRWITPPDVAPFPEFQTIADALTTTRRR